MVITGMSFNDCVKAACGSRRPPISKKWLAEELNEPYQLISSVCTGYIKCDEKKKKIINYFKDKYDIEFKIINKENGF